MTMTTTDGRRQTSKTKSNLKNCLASTNVFVFVFLRFFCLQRFQEAETRTTHRFPRPGFIFSHGQKPAQRKNLENFAKSSRNDREMFAKCSRKFCDLFDFSVFLLPRKPPTCMQRNIGELEICWLSNFQPCTTLGAHKNIKKRFFDFFFRFRFFQLSAWWYGKIFWRFSSIQV